MNIGVLIFSRFDSKRLPGKALEDINGRELLGRVIDISKKIVQVSGVVVATSDRDIDNVIASFATGENVDVFRGNVDDVASRAIKICKKYGWDGFVRVCGDRPFFDASIVNAAVQSMIEAPCDLVTTTGDFTLPAGLTTEVMLFSTFERAYAQFTKEDKEHLTMFFYKNIQSFSVRHLDYPLISLKVYPTSLVVDNEVDLQRACWVARHLDFKNYDACLQSEVALELAFSWDLSHSNNFN